MAYEYDIFLSYPRGKDDVTGKISAVETWVNETFFPKLSDLLAHCYNRKVKIFIDKREISMGEPWAEEILTALAKSCCLITIWSCEYFKKEWCRKELSVMLQREEILKKCYPEKSYRIILPICVCDGNYFPKLANDIQQLKWHRYLRDDPSFRIAPRHMDWEDEMESWIENIVIKVLEERPEWDDEWLKKEWIEASFNKYDLSLRNQQFIPYLV